MNDFDEALEKLRKDLYQNPLIKEYFSLKKQLDENKDILKLNEDLKTATSNGNIDLLNKLKLEYDNHPIVNNFKIIKDEVDNLLLQIKEILLDK